MGTSRTGCAHRCRTLFSTPFSLLHTLRCLASLASQVLPFVIPLTYFLLLPRPDAFSSLVISDAEEAVASSEYTQLPVSEEDAGEAVVETAPLKTKTLSMSDKWQLLKPMLPRYMAPLCMCPYFCESPENTYSMGCIVFVYLVSSLILSPTLHSAHCIVAFVKFEYTINQGVAPTLVYPVSTPETSPVFGRIIHSIRDYYPLWQVRLGFCFIVCQS